MAVSVPTALWDGVLDITKRCQKKREEPFLWAIQISGHLNMCGVSLPSVELAHILVFHICWDNNVPIAWKYLEQSISSKIAPPILVLGLVSARAIPCRRSRPAAYRLCLELLKRHAFSYESQISGQHCRRIMKSVDDALHLYQVFGVQEPGPGELVVEFVFAIVLKLLDATLEDDGLQDVSIEKQFKWASQQDMEVDVQDQADGKKEEIREALRKSNSVEAVKLIGQFLQHKLTSRLLRLASKNLASQWEGFMRCLTLLEAKSISVRNSGSSESLLHLSSHIQKSFSQEFKDIQHPSIRALINIRPLAPSTYQNHGANRSSLWIPLDLFLEDTMDGSQVTAESAIKSLADLVKSLQAINGITWHETFLGLWMAALRFVQRERDPIEGPVPRLDARLCILLCITTLAIADIIEEEDTALADERESMDTSQRKEKPVIGRRRKDLITSLKMLGDFESLLAPPQSVISVANQAAAKAMMFISGFKVGGGYFDSISLNDVPNNCAGNMRHLIVEACIARHLLDTSAYFWPGYVCGHMNQVPRNMSGQVSGWPALMKGAPLSTSMVNSLVTTPASSLAELEKVFEIAVSGPDDDKISAATILCSASLIRGWNIQEHTVRLAVRLLSPPPPADYHGSDSHLISYAPMIFSVLVGISSVDSVHVFSLHGMVPQLAASLMPICEVFGSRAPNITWKLPTGEELSVHMLFSTAFILLMRLWRFNCPPLEHCVLGKGASLGSQLTPEYLLLVRNSQLASSGNKHREKKFSSQEGLSNRRVSFSSTQPIFMESFPKLSTWYRQHQACLASTLSGLVHGTPFHQVVDGLLSMMFRKLNKGGPPGASASSSFSSSSGNGSDDISQRPMLPAWEIMEAVPFVVDAALTACSHGRLYPRELATGLKILADFLPASLATIVSYFSAEVTRGVWKPAFMNGTDWPSPAANLSYVEAAIKKVVATTGADVPSLEIGGSSPVTLPLPLAAFVSLTITYKLDHATEPFLNLAGPALEGLAADCPWPSMPIVASLWTQKAKRWNDFLIFSASRTVFLQSTDAVVQLLQSCFSATLDSSSGNPLSSNGGVGALLGHGLVPLPSGGLLPVAPGILYLRMYRSIRDILFVTKKILSVLVASVTEIATKGMSKEEVAKLSKSKYGMRYGHLSLSAAMGKAKQAAALGASLLWLSGGTGLVQMLFQETLPSWFLSKDGLQSGEAQGKAAMLIGYALAYFAMLSGAFAWGVDSFSKRRPGVLSGHLDFLAGVLDGQISLSCNWATWHAYVSGFLGLIVASAPKWVGEVNVDTLKRLSRGLRLLDEKELALSLLEGGGAGAMGAAAELVIGSPIFA
ncbi:Mediator of RNA polymerase II transcription subunit 33A [Nymphaea thermarum]|nr:Mediator of RNA polymerase II transcription subunit 33A [Nymphaea thermarum]